MADREATRALKSTTGQKFYVPKKTRDEYNDSNRITMTRKQRQQYIKKQQQKQKQQGKHWWNRLDYNIEEEEEFMEMGCRTNADCTSGNCENGKCVRFKPSFEFGQKKSRRKSTRKTYAQQSEERIKKKTEEINNKEITRIVKLSRKTRTQKESQELNRLLSRHPEIKRKRVGRQAITPGSFPNLKF